MQAAPLWDASTCQFAGLLTVTDFIDILRHYKQAGKDVAALAVSSIQSVLADQDFEVEFHGADSSCTLQQACQQLLKSKSDFLPVVFAEDMRVLACITYTNMLEHLVTHFREQRRLFDDSLPDLGIGTYGTNLVSVFPDQSLAQALELMHNYSLSALPVLDKTSGKIIGVYSRSDITFLTKATDAEDAVRNLDLPVSEMLSQQRTDVTTPDALRTCSASHTLQAIFESFAQLRFNRLYVVDEESRLLGVVSARDLVAYFIQE
jgi:CBS domain-containing protein